MHKYLRAIGFSKYNKKSDIRTLLAKACNDPTSTSMVCEGQDLYGYVSRSFGDRIGIRVFGFYDEDQIFREEYYFPYVESDVVSSKVPCNVERHSDRMAYGGIIDDPGMGMSLIFYLNNGIDYINRQRSKEIHKIKNVSLNGLCVSGKILLPVQKTEKEKEKMKSAAKQRESLIEKARHGDESAMESLAMEDMNIFQNVSRRITREDIYSIVDTCFMPYGLESDQYSVIGEIQNIDRIQNRLTGEWCYRMTMECNRLNLTVTINAQDLLGEPAVGRRFKGDIWLQGTAIFEQ